MPPVYAPERVARAIVRLARRPRREVVVGTAGRGLWLQAKVTPGLVERLMADHVDRTHLSRDQAAPDTAGNLHQPSQDAGSVDGGWHGRRRTAVRRAGVLATALTATLVGRRMMRSE